MLGGSTTLNAAGANNYVWSNGLYSGTPFFITVTNTYTVTGTDANGCTNISNINIQVSNGLNIIIAPNNPFICVGDSIQLNASGSTYYSWSPAQAISNPNQANVNVYPLSNISYTVKGKDANGCVGTTQVNVEVDAHPNLQVEKSGDITCEINSVQLSASGASTYQWTPINLVSQSTNDATQATPIITSMFYINGFNDAYASIDSIEVAVYNNDEKSIFIQGAFSPNNDFKNDCVGIKHNTQFDEFKFCDLQSLRVKSIRY